MLARWTGTDPSQSGLGLKIGAGLLSGAIAITVGNPADLVKVRMQGDKPAQGQLPRYSSAFAAYPDIVKNEGVTALWTG